MRRRTAQGPPGSDNGVHRIGSDTEPATEPADSVPHGTLSVPVEHPDPAGEDGDSDVNPVAEWQTEWETVAARPLIDDVDVVDDVTAATPTEAASPVADDVAESSAETAEVVGSRGRGRLIVTSVLLVLTVACGVLSFWFFSEANSLRNEGPAANHALADPAATSEVNGQITNAVQQTFSYDFADTAKTENAAKNFLVGSAIQQYNDLYAVVKQLAPQQKLVLTTTVRASAVTLLQGNRAQLLVFVDQNDTRTDTGQSNSDTGQISIGAVKQGNQWKIEQIEQR